MGKTRWSITVEFTEEMFMKDFIECVNESDWRKWVEFKIIKNKKEHLTTVEEMISQIKEIVSREDG